LADIGDGQWVFPYIAEAASRALGSLVGQTSYIEPKSVKVCQAATCGALAGIRDAVSRRATEAVRTGLLFPPHSSKASRIAKAVDAAMGEGLHSSRMLGEHAVTQAYSQATLDALEARGVTHVGTHGEHCLRDAGLLDSWMADEARHTPQEQHPRSGRYVTKAVHARETHRHIRTGRFTSQKVRAGKQAQAEAEEAKAESRRGPVVVETAGDDRVCDICDGIAANSPYTINQARSLIPAHPNCRCEWVRAEAPARPSLLGPIPEEAERVLELPQPVPVTAPGIAAVAAGVLASLAAAAVARPGRPPAPPVPPDPDEVLSEEPPAPPPLPAKPAPPLPEPPQLPAEEPAAEPPEPEPPLPPIEFALPAELMPQPLEFGAAPLEPGVAELINRIATRRGVLPGSLTQFYPAGAPSEIGAARRELMWTLRRRGWSIAAIAGWMHATERNIFPDLDTKRDIIQNAIDLFTQVGLGTPRVAILSAVETVTSKIPSTIEAAALCKMAERGQITGGILDGPLAFDNAIHPEAARIKGINSAVAGRAQILVVPDLEAGNMLAKNLTFLAKADAAGIVLGARVPIILTSRADSVRARMASCAAAVLYADARRRTGAMPAA
jgi:hypothetical protein